MTNIFSLFHIQMEFLSIVDLGLHICVSPCVNFGKIRFPRMLSVSSKYLNITA